MRLQLGCAKLFMKQLKELWEKVSNTILPASCLLCADFVDSNFDALCLYCWQKLKFITEPRCAKCSQPCFNNSIRKITCDVGCSYINHHYNNVYSCVHYNDAAKQIIKGLKYNNSVRYTELIARIMYFHYKEAFDNADCIISVPSYLLKLWQKGYNHSGVIARRISKVSNIPYKAGILLKVVNTASQSSLTKKQREQNLRKAFYVLPKYNSYLKDKRVVIIDDVFTTGSTANACAIALRKASVKEVNIVTFAKSVIL